jgi:two-component system response regulator GlrR
MSKCDTLTAKKILLVDDDTDLLELLSIRLSAAGFETITTNSAEAAINCLDLTRPHLVISDMQMSGLDGMALFEHIHRTNPTLPVIILTAYGTIPDAVNAVQRGIFGYLTKPYDPKTLLDQVDQALRLSCTNPVNDQTEASWRKTIITQSAEVEDLLTKVELVADGDERYLNFDVLNDSIIAGSRSPKLKGRILISKANKDETLETYWESIYN